MGQPGGRCDSRWWPRARPKAGESAFDLPKVCPECGAGVVHPEGRPLRAARVDLPARPRSEDFTSEVAGRWTVAWEKLVDQLVEEGSFKPLQISISWSWSS